MFTPWTLLVDAGIISVLLLIGKLIRVKSALVQKFFIPPSLIAGFLGLALGNEGLGILPFSGMLGTYARTESVIPFKPVSGRIGYKAKVSIVQGDNILSTAEAIATSNGYQTKEHAIFSMAQTRAMGKAYRMAFSWIIELAGFQATPAEEMTSEEILESQIVQEYHEPEPSFTTANNVEPIHDDPVSKNWVKTFCKILKSQGKPCRKGVLIKCAKTCEKLSSEEKEQVILYIKSLPNGEVELDD